MVRKCTKKHKSRFFKRKATRRFRNKQFWGGTRRREHFTSNNSLLSLQPSSSVPTLPPINNMLPMRAMSPSRYQRRRIPVQLPSLIGNKSNL